MIDYSMEHLFSFNATLDPPEVIGPTPEGLRLNVYVTGGSVSGPKLNGKLRPVGADWLTIRLDGVAILDVRATIEADDGALIYVTYSGIMDLGEDGYDKMLNGEPVPSGVAIRISPFCRTSDAKYLWMNRTHCIGIGQAFIERGEVIYDVYAVR